MLQASIHGSERHVNAKQGNTYKLPELALVLDLNAWLPALLRDLEGSMLHITFDFRMVKRSSRSYQLIVLRQ